MDDRRQHTRYAFSATAEVVDLASGARLSTRVADLNKGGCYLDMMNPLPIGCNVSLRISRDGIELKCTGVVRNTQPGMGMGVAFSDLDDARRAIIDSWIEKLNLPALADHSQPPPPEKAMPVATPDQREALAVELIDLLHKKGLLSSNEVASLLRDRIL